MKIAIVGGGISGNLVARLLAQEHEISLFEAEQRVGGHAAPLASDPEVERPGT